MGRGSFFSAHQGDGVVLLLSSLQRKKGAFPRSGKLFIRAALLIVCKQLCADASLDQGVCRDYFKANVFRGCRSPEHLKSVS